MFISNISQNQSTVFKQSLCIEKMFPSRKNLIRYMNDVPGFADALGVQMPKSTAEEKTVYDIFVQKVHEMMLALDARALKPIIKLPDPCNKKEKAAIIEYLEHRQLIDRLAEWASQRGKIITDGVNADSIKAIKDLDKKISRVDMRYFDKLGYLTDLCCPEKNVREPLITDELRALYWDYLNQGNINKDGTFTAKQLLDIVRKTEEAPVQVQKEPAATAKTKPADKVKPNTKILTRSSLLDNAERDYELFLRRHINFYEVMYDEFLNISRLMAEKEKINNLVLEKFNRQFTLISEFVKRNNIDVKVLADVISGRRVLREIAPNESAEKLFEIEQDINKHRSEVIQVVEALAGNNEEKPIVLRPNIKKYAKFAHNYVYDKYTTSISKYESLERSNKIHDDLLNRFTKVTSKYNRIFNEIGGLALDGRNVGFHWDNMKDGILEIKGYAEKIAELEQKLNLNDSEVSVIKELVKIKICLDMRDKNIEERKFIESQLADGSTKAFERSYYQKRKEILINEIAKITEYADKLTELKRKYDEIECDKSLLKIFFDTEYKYEYNKDIWTSTLERAILDERVNRQLSVERNCQGKYNYIVGENKLIGFLRELDEIREENDGILPDEIWNKMFAYADRMFPKSVNISENDKLFNEAWAKILE